MSRERSSDDDDFKFLTAQEVSVMVPYSVSTLHEYAQRRELGLPSYGPPHVQLGPRRRRWLRRDVLAWIEACRVSGQR
ncbi:helix-turn-helix transcriptional regulator [Mycobacteroides abscessus]|nr:hypothetical protein [Mycobacteroides abscessus]AMU64500.1 hypothetical protein A3O04_03815 [Mycobacteroides abscessus]OTR10540.1 hypothetical protein B9M83_04250 [Mycobacteroides abscessus]OTR17293.1 hypothetical protein B9M82_04830 [Mycobacteroides abscessus]OTR31707.1 hypothetical protein B9M78_03930 [Mycobacteroides abscessus]